MSQGVSGLVERQIRRWEVARRSLATEPTRPCIAFSRFPGTAAEEVAERLAQLLGFAFFGIGLVEQIARESGLQEQLVAGVDEHVRSSIDRFVADAFRRDRFTESDYVHRVVRVIATLGERGGAVILGRGSPYVLTPDLALRVLLVAPHAARVERIAAENKLSREQAEANLAEEDRNRHAFLRLHFKGDPDDPLLYDLTLNTGTFSVEAAARAIHDVYQVRFPAAARATR